MRKVYSILLLGFCFAALLPACSPGQDQLSNSTDQLTDGLGRTIPLNGPAQKIVSIAPSNTEILYALGAGSQVIGRDEFSNYPEQALSLPSVGGSMGNYSMEAIAALQPDLVLAAEINTPEQVKALEELGLRVFYVSNPSKLEDIYANMDAIATLTGREKEARQIKEGLQQRIKQVQDAMAGVTNRPKVYYELDATDPARPYTSGPGTFVDQLIQIAGGDNIGATLNSPWAQISQEEIIAQNPDIILLGNAAYGNTPEMVSGLPGWENIAAVKNGKIYAFNDDLVSRPTPRLVDGLVELAKIFHPQQTTGIE